MVFVIHFFKIKISTIRILISKVAKKRKMNFQKKEVRSGWYEFGNKSRPSGIIEHRHINYKLHLQYNLQNFEDIHKSRLNGTLKAKIVNVI